MIGRLARKTAIPGRSPSTREDSPFGPSDILHVGVPNAGRAAAAVGGHYAPVFLAWDSDESRGNSSRLGCGLPTSHRWWSQNTSRAAQQRSSAMQVGCPGDEAC